MERGLIWLRTTTPPGCPCQNHVTVSACLSVLVVLVALPLACLALPSATNNDPLLWPDACTYTRTPDNVTVVGATCASGDLTSVPHHLPTTLVSLDLRRNAIRHLDVSNLTLLQVLDVSYNALTVLQVPSLDNLFQLTVLDLSDNNISAVEDRVFGALASVERLTLAHNKLQSVTSDQLFGLQTAKVLNMSWNFIKELDNGTFFYLTHLEVLDLSHNDLQSLAPSVFHGLQSLRHLLLHHNRLATIAGPFHSLPQLLVLDLSQNNLQELGNSMFTDLPLLNTIQLSFNKIVHISSVFCSNLFSAQTLNLSGNALEQLQGGVLRGLPNLKTLDLSQMPYLRSVSHNAFDSLQSLSLLNLSLNPQLSFFHPQVLTPLTALSLLDLRWCHLPTLSQITFHTNPLLTSVYLAHNPFQCGCGLLWMLGPNPHFSNVTGPSIVSDLNSTTCQLQSNENQTVLVAQLWELPVNCTEVRLHNVTSSKVVRMGNSLLLNCEYTMDETGILSWFTPQGLVFHYHPYHPEATSHTVSREDAINLNSPFHQHHEWHNQTSYASNLYQRPDRVVLLSDGSLFIDYVLRSDAGNYTCVVHNAQYRMEGVTVVTFDSILFEVKIMSILVGLACAATFFTLNAVYVVIMWVARTLINKRRRERIHKIMASVEDYRSTHIARIRANYSYQIGRIREHYQCQSTRLRDNYNTQIKRVRRGCSNQVDKVRDNYHQRLTHLKDYSSHQIQQICDVTNNQIVRIRDYGSLQMEKLRETYKLQSKHVLKMMEAMNLDNCKNVMDAECMRADSIMLDLIFPDFPLVEEESGSAGEAEEACSQSGSIYTTALNTDVSSQESLDTVVNIGCITTVEDITIEVLPTNTPPTPTIVRETTIVGDIQVLPSDSYTLAGCEGETGNDGTSKAIKETIV